jgi:hypothetical protein
MNPHERALLLLISDMLVKAQMGTLNDLQLLMYERDKVRELVTRGDAND